MRDFDWPVKTPVIHLSGIAASLSHLALTFDLCLPEENIFLNRYMDHLSNKAHWLLLSESPASGLLVEHNVFSEGSI